MNDWETPSSTGFGGGFGRGAGRGGSSPSDSIDKKSRGFGRGRKSDSAGTSSSGFGGGFGRGGGSGGFGAPSGNSGGGFGAKPMNSGGFGSKPNASGDDAWEEGTTNGFGSGMVKQDTNNNRKGGGFGGGFSKPAADEEWSESGSHSGRGGSSSFESKGFGSKGFGGGGFGGGGGGFGRSTGSGFGGGGFGSRGDDGEKKSGSRSCFKCGEEGHMSRDCPSADRSGGGRGKGCFKCGEDGHISRDCPSGGGGGGKGRGCFKCGEEGHMSRECPNNEQRSGGFGGKTGGGFGGGGGGGFGGGGGSGSGGACFKCGEEGHFSRECPNSATDPDKPKASTYVPPAPPEDEEGIFTPDVVKGINFDKYDDIPVECTGNDKPTRGISSFDEIELNSVCLENLRRAKYTTPTPVQKWTMPCILKGRDVMACAQTGSGKTAAFLLPIITGMITNGIEGSAFSEKQTPQCVVVGPTRELVLQIRDQARKFSYNTMVRPVVVYGGTSSRSQQGDVQKGCHLLVGTPGRLLDFIEKGFVSLEKCKYLVLDEADRMLDMGFLPSIRKLVTQLGMPEKTERQTLMFSATFPGDVQHMAADFLNNYIFVTIGRVGGANTDITQTVIKIPRSEKRDRVVAILNEQSSVDRTLIFVEQKRQADFLASFLSQSSFPTTSIHGDRLQNEREEALRDFKLGRAPVLVATSVAARGLDINDVKHVINFDLPKDIDEYVHRIGRTGRCGNMGKATSFYDSDNDRDLARSLIKVLSQAQQDVPDWLEEEAQDTYGTGFKGAGGQFGAKDTRKENFTSSGADDWSSGGGGSSFGGGGFTGAMQSTVTEEESWD